MCFCACHARLSAAAIPNGDLLKELRLWHAGGKSYFHRWRKPLKYNPISEGFITPGQPVSTVCPDTDFGSLLLEMKA